MDKRILITGANGYIGKTLYNDLKTGNASTWAPTDSQFQVQLQPIYSRDSVKKFSMREFVTGNLINKEGIGFI